jgi:hypothetical protein
MKAQIAIEKVSSKLLRPWIGNFVSKKRISQGFFARLVQDLNGVFEGRHIGYLSSSDLSNFLANQDNRNFRRVIVAGGSDYDPTLSDYRLLIEMKSTRFYIQNLNFPETELVKSLPIGVEDYRWARNAMPWNFSQRMIEREKLPLVLVGPFGATHPERERCLQGVTHSQVCEVYEDRIPNWTYSKLSSKYLFVACPRGNGLDTHRFWETIYRGSIPVVIQSNWAKNMKSYGIPMVTISDWWEIDRAIADFKESLMGTNPNYLSPKWWRERFIRDLLDQRLPLQG